MKLALLRCLQTEEVCSVRHCLEFIYNQEGSLADREEEIEFVALSTCGGCPGKTVKESVENMVEAGVDTIIFSSCIKLGTPIGYVCPHVDKLKAKIKEVEQSLEIIDWTHQETFNQIIWHRIKSFNLGNFLSRGMSI